MSQPLTHVNLTAPIVGNIWQIQVAVGDEVEAGQTVMILESMKMEIPIPAPSSSVVQAIPVEVNQIVQEGSIIAVLAVIGA